MFFTNHRKDFDLYHFSLRQNGEQTKPTTNPIQTQKKALGKHFVSFLFSQSCRHLRLSVLYICENRFEFIRDIFINHNPQWYQINTSLLLWDTEIEKGKWKNSDFIEQKNWNKISFDDLNSSLYCSRVKMLLYKLLLWIRWRRTLTRWQHLT